MYDYDLNNDEVIDESSGECSACKYYIGDNSFGLFLNHKIENPDDAVDLSREAFYPDLHFTYNLTEKQSIQFGVSKRD